jgi:branched-chain amino acid aminotransferase
MEKVDFIWMNGKLVKWDDARIHILTHTLHYGAGVFEGIRCYNTLQGPAVFRLKDHIKRLVNSARMIKMPLPYNAEQLCKATKDVIRANKIKACYIRPIVYYGYGEMGLDPSKSPVDAAIAIWPWGTYLGEEGLRKGVKCKISSWRRIDKRTLPAAAKVCGFYVNSILSHLEATAAGCSEAILLNTEGNVAEGPGENIFIVKNGKLFTPPLSAGILNGITRASIIRIARNIGIGVKEKNITKAELYKADELFFTGTAAEVTPIREVDGRKIGKGSRGPITERLQSKFFDIVKGKDRKYGAWLDSIG